MTTEIALPDAGGTLQIFGRTPDEMVRAQKQVILWCARKIVAEKAELKEAVENEAQARKNKWRHEPWRRRVKKHERKIEFYKKIKHALESGFYIVPPFPIDVFAIRVREHYGGARNKVRDLVSKREFMLAANADKLPAGEGKYVDPVPKPYYAGYYKTTEDGKKESVERWRAGDWADVDFPFQMVRPEVIQQVTDVMAQKLFDDLGVLPSTQRTKRDPLVVGRIFDPTKGQYQTPMHFFVAWWLDYEAI